MHSFVQPPAAETPCCITHVFFVPLCSSFPAKCAIQECRILGVHSIRPSSHFQRTCYCSMCSLLSLSERDSVVCPDPKPGFNLAAVSNAGQVKPAKCPIQNCLAQGFTPGVCGTSDNLVPAARFVPNLQFLFLPIRSELIHCSVEHESSHENCGTR